MAFCNKCGAEISEEAKFCLQCGAALVGDDPGVKKKQGSKSSFILPIILCIIAGITYYSDPPVLTIVLGVLILIGGVICFLKNCRWKYLAIIAMLVACYCIYAAWRQGNRFGYLVTPTDADYQQLRETSKSKQEKVPLGVDPDLKAFLDSYEEFMDEYIDFMQNSLSNPGNVFGMLADYGNIMQKYDDFSKKIDAYDTKTMSPADAAYYLEVVGRVELKLVKMLQ